MPDRLQRGAGSHTTGQLDDSHPRQPHHPQSERSADEPDASTPHQESTVPNVPNSLLGDVSLSRRGNATARQAALLSVQSTYGNRAVQRLLRRTAGGTASDATSTVQPQSNPPV